VFKTTLTVNDWNEIIEEWGEAPTKFYWWMRKSCFGMFFLHKMCLRGHKKLKKITWKDWHIFIPYIHRFFLSFKEYHQIIRNLAYIKEDIRIGIKETPFFKAYIIGELYSMSVSFSELWNMDYKNFFKLYLYSIGDKLMIKQEKKGEYHR